jgi:hypothetical protein
MPPFPSETFLLWHEAGRIGHWQRLLRKRLTPNIWLSILLLQEIPFRADNGEDIAEIAAAAIASGWGQ